MLVLGIETSCDETGVALYDTEKGLVAEALHSQVDLHAVYGGVVPEIASRAHIEWLDRVIREAMTQAECTADAIDAIAVTQRPGLVGSLLIGVTMAKTLSWAWDKPLVAVDHLDQGLAVAHPAAAHAPGHAPRSQGKKIPRPAPSMCLAPGPGHYPRQLP